MKKNIAVITIIFTIVFLCNGYAQKGRHLNNRIMVEGFYTRNLGSFGEIWSNSVGGYVGYGLAFPDHNLLIIRTGFISNNLNEEIKYANASSVIIPLELGGRYYFLFDGIQPFIQFINGLNLIFENTNLEGVAGNKTFLKYCWQVGLGVTVYLNNQFGIDIGVNYQSNFYQTNAMNTGFEYVLGLSFSMD